ncbi:hypothetical protein RSSM_01624 [Rhodopirellula sallentina SM41]|uniref:Uncharacterized protein n=1 Tax=Rhodopirellula sallentina SM41 TaxID=1263870 RepID=M5ULP6_9BACT|nr:hypothetical protein RSSM_01624 [Rhodopirellula sallentina SM41]
MVIGHIDHRQHSLDRRNEVFVEGSFGNVARRPESQCFRSDFFTTLGGGQDNRQTGKLFTQCRDQLQPIHFRHLEVGHDDGGSAFADRFQGGAAVARRHHFIAVLLQHDLHTGDLSDAVINGEDEGGFRHVEFVTVELVKQPTGKPTSRRHFSGLPIRRVQSPIVSGPRLLGWLL